jgi:hypothetical protein
MKKKVLAVLMAGILLFTASVAVYASTYSGDAEVNSSNPPANCMNGGQPPPPPFNGGGNPDQMHDT